VSRQDEGASLLFSPVHGDAIDLAVAEVEHLIHQSPHVVGLPRDNWWLDGLRRRVSWLWTVSLPTVANVLKRFHLASKRGRQYLHSPDPAYSDKLRKIEAARILAQQAPEEVVFLHGDEKSYSQAPRPALAYSQRGDKGRKAHGTPIKQIRIAGCLDVATGQVLARQRDSFNAVQMQRWLVWIADHYPHARVIYLALDNWPVHFAPEMLSYVAVHVPRLRLLRLPTYVPWTNPIEKVWLKLCREVLDHHPFGQDWEALKAAVMLWLDEHRQSSEEMLRFVGLLSSD